MGLNNLFVPKLKLLIFVYTLNHSMLWMNMCPLICRKCTPNKSHLRSSYGVFSWVQSIYGLPLLLRCMLHIVLYLSVSLEDSPIYFSSRWNGTSQTQKWKPTTTLPMLYLHTGAETRSFGGDITDRKWLHLQLGLVSNTGTQSVNDFGADDWFVLLFSHIPVTKVKWLSNNELLLE